VSGADVSSAREIARQVLSVESQAIAALLDRLDGSFDAAVECLVACSGRVVLCGMGKSGLVARKIAATLSSTGTPALFVHPAEAAHGDLGGIVPGDVVICTSQTGETEELLRLLPLIRQVASKVIAITGNSASTLARGSDLVLDVAVSKEACPLNLAPTASTTATLAMGDALAMAAAARKGFTEEDFGRTHPAGSLGRRFARVADLMHAGDELPRVAPDARMRDVITEMTRKGFGMTTVVDGAGKLVGAITDGDLRRLLHRDADPLARIASDVMTATPRTCSPDLLAMKAVELMEAPQPKPVQALVVVDAESRAVGILRLHDVLSTRR
jgi:arabinose-5-phosphate isomerase